MTQADSSSIPTLTDVLVPGKPVPARASAADASSPHDDAAIPVLTDVVAPARAAEVPGAPQHVDTDPESVVVEPVPTPYVPAVELPGDSDAPAEPGAAERVVAEESAAMQAPLRSALAADDSQPHDLAAVPHETAGHSEAAGLPEALAPAVDAPVPDHLAGVRQPDAAAALTAEDAQCIAERLRNRLTNYLTGEGREAIEARCRDALHDHTAWLVGQITREVALALETEVMDWVRDAVDDEIARRRSGHSG
ncbi:DUF2486 family protein [Burkholderia sp. Bp9017]|uniref:DUF2486 family protein n=1 Tax=Burkholderia anthina TaxID=179879 RepID=A0A7T6VDQ0_9BURK|nr:MULTISPECIES: DUF2486 family protein [Burkholderia]MBY4868505.1 DUF2486 family protein [Burkholderia anthina]QQK01934.1 DUF2486 family protein [Burkholderia anthina]RQZ28190.1 DUF2486 family protein [Burkholderia sp. Bp9017]RQZ34819.1 DUF2486 family protein [Burkholderia sp. Bp9016]